jgi:hypothetical protein
LTLPLTRLSAQSLIQAFVYPSLQHFFYLISAVIVKTFKAKLLAGLLASDEFTLYSQPPVSHLLSAVVAHLLPPYPILPKYNQKYFF